MAMTLRSGYAWSKRATLEALRGLTGGSLCLECRDRSYRFGQPSDLDVRVDVHDERLFRRALLDADIGIGESYMAGEWTASDLVGLGRLMFRNRYVLDGQRSLRGLFSGGIASIARRFRDNSLTGSRRHIRHHYDLGNDFFRLFLDTDLVMYSSGYFDSARDTLEAAQTRKVDRICRLLRLGPGDRVLEIGSGWGGFATWAAAHYGCSVTTTTISDEQYRYIRGRQAAAGGGSSRVNVLNADYRELTGQFDKIVSIEMFEAVGLAHYDAYFAAVDRLLTPDGAMVLQTITVADQWFPVYRRSADWIEKYIFPGGELASIGGILESLARTTSLSMYAAENFGTHYARTLQVWRSRFLSQLDAVRRLGFDEPFIRAWEFYLAICEAAFLERHTGVFQLLLAKNGASGRFFNEPWSDCVETAATADQGSAA